MGAGMFTSVVEYDRIFKTNCH